MSAPDTPIRVLPASEVGWEELQTVLGARGMPHRCQCQYLKLRDREWNAATVEELADRLHEQTACGEPGAPRTAGLVAFLHGEPVGWCAVEPRTAYPRLRYNRIPWQGREEDPSDDGVWAVTCFVTRVGFRKRGVSRAPARAAVDLARERGARAVEGYPMTTTDAIVRELYVGTRSVFEDAGFTEVSRPTLRRVVMRIDF